MGQEPRTPYYATPGFQQSPNEPDDIKVSSWPPLNKLVPQVGKTLEVVTELEYVPVGNDDPELREGTMHHSQHNKIMTCSFSFAVPTPPLSPSVYLTLRPWTLPEYLLLLSIKPLSSKTDNMHWDEIASKLNAVTRHQSRSAWDCWHRWVVPWCRPQHASKPRPDTYPHAPGVQHEYKFSDLEGLIELWASLSSVIGTSQGVASPLGFPGPQMAAVQPRRAEGRAHHPGAHPTHLILCVGS